MLLPLCSASAKQRSVVWQRIPSSHLNSDESSRPYATNPKVVRRILRPEGLHFAPATNGCHEGAQRPLGHAIGTRPTFTAALVRPFRFSKVARIGALLTEKIVSVHELHRLETGIQSQYIRSGRRSR